MPGLHGTMFIDCPCCSARIEVDRESGKVLQHWTKREKPQGDLLQHALKKLKSDQEKLAGFFETAQEEMKEKKRKALERFEAERRRILESGDATPPPRPFDNE